MNQVSLNDANKAFFKSLRSSSEPQKPDISANTERREFLAAEIERLTEKRPGANTKTETLEKQYAELTKDPE